MADVITRFKLETTQYDSKLRDAAKGLSEFVKQAEIGGKGFTNFSQKSIEAARALGTVTSGANNLKDKVKDLVGAYNDAAKAYNKLSQEQQQSDFGKALAQSIGQLSERIKDAKQELYGLDNAVEQVKSKAGGGLFGEGGLTGMLAVTGGNLLASGITKLGSEIADTVQQSIELAKSGEGVRLAFDRLNQPELLANLKEATHGTVSELKLMKAAVKFDDFKLPVEQLGTLLAFAQKKAKDTGQSVDYMVDSIVTGLGRKSLMILDNLGLSAAQVKERMAETGDMTTAVASIIKEQMSEAGEYVETAADRAARAAAEASDKMEKLGREAMPVAEEWNKAWNSIKLGGMEVLTTVLDPIAESINDIQQILSGEFELKIKANIPNLADGPLPTPKKQPGKDHTVYAPGGYVEVTDSNTGAVIGGQHFNNLKDVNAIKDWQKSLFKTPKVPKAPKAPKTEEQLNNEQIGKLTQEYIKATDERRKAIESEIKTLQKRNEEIKKLTDIAQGKIAPEGSLDALNEELKKLQTERGKLSNPIEIEIQDQQIKEVQDEIDRLNGKKVAIDIEANIPDLRTPFERLQDSIKLELSAKNVDVDKNTLKSLTEVVTKYDIQTGTIDISKVMAQTEELTKGGMEAGAAYAKALQDAMVENLDLSTIQQRIGDEINIPDDTWQALQDQINEKLKGLGIEPIKIDFSTGNVKKQSKEMSKDWQSAAQAVQAVGSAMASIEDPAAKVVGTVAQAIASIALGYSQATVAAAQTGNPWVWAAFAATGLGQMISTISAIHAATGYAEGGMIKGNSYSGDNIGGLVDGSQFVGLNAGEVVLSASQQSVLAGNLQAAGGGKMEIVGVLTGENVVLMADRWGRRTGRGELLFGKDL
jgi:hypothetical protein